MSSADNTTLSAVIKDMIEKRLMEVNTALPCTVTEYDAEKNTVSLELGTKRKFVGATIPIPLPILNNVPVQLPRSLDKYLFFEMEKDTEGLVVFSQRSIDIWMQDGGVVDPQDGRTFDLSDAIFIPGLSSEAGKIERKGEGVELRNKDAYIDLLEDGKIAIKNAEQELIDLIQKVDNLVGDVASLAGNISILLGNTNLTLSTDVTAVPSLGTWQLAAGIAGTYSGYQTQAVALKVQADLLKSNADQLSTDIGTFIK